MSGSGGVKADLDVMQGVASKMASDYEQLQQTITTLQREAETHSATWSGEAKAAWSNAMEGVNLAWSRLNSVLHEISSNISATGGQYSDTDGTNASSFSKVPTTDITAALSR